MSDPASAENAIKFPTVDEVAANLQKVGDGLIIGLSTIVPGINVPSTTTNSLALDSEPVDADASVQPAKQWGCWTERRRLMRRGPGGRTRQAFDRRADNERRGHRKHTDVDRSGEG